MKKVFQHGSLKGQDFKLNCAEVVSVEKVVKVRFMNVLSYLELRAVFHFCLSGAAVGVADLEHARVAGVGQLFIS